MGERLGRKEAGVAGPHRDRDRVRVITSPPLGSGGPRGRADMGPERAGPYRGRVRVIKSHPVGLGGPRVRADKGAGESRAV